ncbi:MAG: RNA 2',3'-cyclic phosphodiesterase [Anaerolineae bacterium]|nr:RNA 2',3'-cyclic phosphodiesterase [Anaerolineae bacterium]
MDTIRAFIAIKLPADVQEVLRAVSEELAPRLPDRAVTWVRPERMHLTLRFLGDTPVAQLEDLVVALDAVAAKEQPFTLQLGQLGAFPNQRRPRVIWVGLAGEVEAATTLQQALDTALVPLGWQPDSKKFSPHLTLGRVKRKDDRINLPWGQAVVPTAFTVSEIHLMESQLRPQGPLYTVRHSSRLALPAG